MTREPINKIIATLLVLVFCFSGLDLRPILFEVQKAEAALAPGEREYMLTVGPISGSTAANYVYASFFNPSGSGRTIMVKRISIRSETGNTTASNYAQVTLRRTTSSSGGTQITATNIPKKNASSTDAILEVRHTNVTVSFDGTIDSRIIGQPHSGPVGAYYSYRDITFGDTDEKFILQPGEGIAVYQEAAGDADSRVRVFLEWEESGNAPSPQNEFLFAFPIVENAARLDYVYGSFFNPATSSKIIIVKRIWFGSETCDNNARYTNNVTIRRITSASGGIAISAANIPKKNTSSSDSVMDIRYDDVVVTSVGGTDARMGIVTPCGAAGQSIGWREFDIHSGDEKIILNQGEGLQLTSLDTGDVDQFMRMIIEWQEVDAASGPASQNEYIMAMPRIESASAANVTRYSFFNPSGSGKVAVIKRLSIRIDADAAANYPAFSFRRLTSASGGVLLSANDVPKKNTDSATSSMEIRWCDAACGTAITAAYAGSVDSRLLSVNGPGAVGQLDGQREIVFGNNEKIILQEGEGVGFYGDVLTSDADQYVKILIEWSEENSAPSAQEEYLIDVGPVNGSTATSYNYVTFFNPSASGKTVIVKRVSVRVDTINAAVYIPMQLRRISAASAGTQITAANIPKKHTSSANSAVEIRHTGVTATYIGTTDSKLLAIQTPGTVSSAAAGNTGYREYRFENEENLILQPGEGVGFYHDTAAGDADFRVKVLFEWQEVATSSTPASDGEYLITTGPVNQSTTNNYVYTSFFNPSTSGKKFVVKRLGMQASRSGAATAPIYVPITARRISSASGGTLIATTSIPKKHQGTATSSAELRHTGVTATFEGVTDSRIINAMAPGVVNQIFGQFDAKIVFGDEIILLPGEGIALYQEGTTGDVNLRHYFTVGWEEVEITQPPQTLSFSISTSTVYFGTLSPVQARYASSTGQGDASETGALNLTVNTNAYAGYAVTVQGATLTYGSSTISAIGGTNTVSSPGTEQFGMRLTASGGSGSVTPPYAASGFAYAATATTTSQIASSLVGDNATTTYSVRMISNISSVTEPGSYTTSLIYVTTANF